MDMFIMRESERRQDPRVSAEDRVVVMVLAASDAPTLEGKTFFCVTRDLSVGGLRFGVHTEVPLGSMLELRVEVSDANESYVHDGKVAWVGEVEIEGIREYLLGVRFVRTRDNRETKWRSLVDARLESLSSAAASETSS
jgi:c-di-GMP-binding flagellar brake protein YcgR